MGTVGTAAVLAGCSTTSSGDPTRSLAVRIVNRLSETQSVTILIVSGEGETVEVAEYDVRPDASRTHRLENPPAGTYRVIVDGVGWKTTANWDTATCSELLTSTTISDSEDGTPHTSLSAECPNE